MEVVCIDKRALMTVAGIAQRYWHSSPRPNQVLNVLQALHDYVIQKGGRPGFELKNDE